MERREERSARGGGGTRLLLVGALMGVVGLSAVAPPAQAEPTAITVRVISKGAKFVGTSMGGARVLIRDAETGELLAAGLTAGSTGDTGRIMEEAHVRPRTLSTEGAARFEAVLDLDRPTRIEVTASGPVAQAQSTNTVSATQWVVPGKPVTGGDGFLLELPGLSVDVLEPAAHVRAGAAPRSMDLVANVTMMCGCPIRPGGLWDADAIEVRAILYRDGERVDEVPLAFDGVDSRFRAAWRAEEPGAYEAVVYAWDPRDGNTGLDRTTFLLAGP